VKASDARCSRSHEAKLRELEISSCGTGSCISESGLYPAAYFVNGEVRRCADEIAIVVAWLFGEGEFTPLEHLPHFRQKNLRYPDSTQRECRLLGALRSE
jgi:hypothetical protein